MYAFGIFAMNLEGSMCALTGRVVLRSDPDSYTWPENSNPGNDRSIKQLRSQAYQFPMATWLQSRHDPPGFW